MIYLYIWIGFVVLVYLTAWFDHVYHKYNLPKHYHQVLDSLTEED